jgi:hypothetical protein
MPYIPQHMRCNNVSLDALCDAIVDHTAYSSEGELAYVLFRVVSAWLLQKGHSYGRFAQAFGVIETVKHELYRRIVSPYEDKKRDENGDVTPEG